MHFRDFLKFFGNPSKDGFSIAMLASACAILLRGIALKLQRGKQLNFYGIAHNRIASQVKIYVEEQNQTKGSARYTKFCDWSNI